MATLFGSTTATGGTDFFDEGDLFGSKYTAVAGSLTAAQVPIGSSGFTSLKIDIYKADGTVSPAGGPGTKLGESDPMTLSGAGIQNFTFSTPITLTAGDIYAIMVPVGGRFNLDNTVTGTGYRGRSFGAGTTTGPSPWPTTGIDDTNSNGIAVLGTGTLGGGGGSTIVSPVQAFGPSYAATRAASI